MFRRIRTMGEVVAQMRNRFYRARTSQPFFPYLYIDNQQEDVTLDSVRILYQDNTPFLSRRKILRVQRFGAG